MAMSGGFTIEPATPADAPAIAAIYAHHVLHGTGTFEIDSPDAAEMAARMAKVLGAGSPWLVARDGAEVIGFAYAAQFRDRSAYRFACEDSIYIRHDRCGQGLGAALLDALIDASAAAGFRQMLAVVGGPEPASLALHARAGFAETGRFHKVGRKFGRWLDIVFMQRALGAGDAAPPREP
jgi:L-amino acid N-acyltransferase YncA